MRWCGVWVWLWLRSCSQRSARTFMSLRLMPYAPNGSAFARFNPFVILFIYYFATCIMELSSSFFDSLFPIYLCHQPRTVRNVCDSFSPSSATFMEYKWIRVVIYHHGIKGSTWSLLNYDVSPLYDFIPRLPTVLNPTFSCWCMRSANKSLV